MENARGVRDFPPEIQLIRENLFANIRIAFERHGFAPFATPAIERTSTLKFKFEGDEDVMHELFTFTDQGDRELGLRFDLTVPLCRFIAQNKDIKLPFKRYEIGRVYRDGPIKLGRYREFWQCDADVIGSSSMLADAECIKVCGDVLATLPFEYVIKVNNRKILDCIMDNLGIKEKSKTMTVLDKLAKQGEKKVKKEMGEFLSKKQVDKLFELIHVEGTPNGILKHVEESIGSCDGIIEMRQLFTFLEDVAHVEFDLTLARGLNYYTGTVFEAFLKDSKVTGSVAGGGRYDNIIGQMRKGKEEIPAVGISLGVEPLTDALLQEKQRFDKTSAKILVAPIKTEREAASLADKFRAHGINTDIDVMSRSISKNLDYANKMGIPFVVVLGEKDISEGVFTLKNMKTGEESKIALSDIEEFDLSEYV